MPRLLGFRGLGDPTPVEVERKRLYAVASKTGSPVFRSTGDGMAEIAGSAERLRPELAAKVVDIELPSCPPGFVTGLVELQAPTATTPGKYGALCMDLVSHETVAPTKKAASVVPLLLAAGAGAGLAFLALKFFGKKR